MSGMGRVGRGAVSSGRYGKFLCSPCGLRRLKEKM